MFFSLIFFFAFTVVKLKQKDMIETSIIIYLLSNFEKGFDTYLMAVHCDFFTSLYNEFLSFLLTILLVISYLFV